MRSDVDIATNYTTDLSVTADDDSYNGQDEDELEALLFYQADKHMWKFCPPVIIVFGSFGNIMTIVIIRRMSEGRSSNSMFLYFTALAVSDLTLLYVGLFHKWILHAFDYDLRLLHHVICKLHIFLIYSCGMVSSWLLVSMTMQRVMSIVWPHHKSLSCSQRQVGIVIAVIVSLITSVNSYMLHFYGVVPIANSTKLTCDSLDKGQLFYFYIYVYPYIDMAMTSLVPFTLLIVSNSVLLWKVIQSVQVARVMTAGGSDQVNSRQKKASSLTVTLITVSLTFLVLTMPICVCNILYPFFDQGSSSSLAKLDFGWGVCDLSWYTSSSVNFYLYVLSGSRFRNEFMRLFFSRPTRDTASTKTSVMSISDTASHTDDDDRMKSDF